MATQIIINKTPVLIGLAWHDVTGSRPRARFVKAVAQAQDTAVGVMLESVLGEHVYTVVDDPGVVRVPGAAWVALALVGDSDEGARVSVVIYPLDDGQYWLAAVQNGVVIVDGDVVLQSEKGCLEYMSELEATFNISIVVSPDWASLAPWTNAELRRESLDFLNEVKPPQLDKPKRSITLIIVILVALMAAGGFWLQSYSREALLTPLDTQTSEEAPRVDEIEAHNKQAFEAYLQAWVDTMASRPQIVPWIEACLAVHHDFVYRVPGWDLKRQHCDFDRVTLQYDSGNDQAFFSALDSLYEGAPAIKMDFNIESNALNISLPLPVVSAGEGQFNAASIRGLMSGAMTELQRIVRGTAASMRFVDVAPKQIQFTGRNESGDPVEMEWPSVYQVGNVILQGLTASQLLWLGRILKNEQSMRVDSATFQSNGWNLEVLYVVSS